MCLALYVTRGATVPREDLEQGFKWNKDGAGFAVRMPGGRIVSQKGFFTFQAFWDAYKHYTKEEAIIHFRWSTAGLKNAENCHPFRLPGQNGYLIHNGHFSAFDDDPKKSDTRVFVETLLTPFLARHPKALRDASVLKLLETAIGGSKLVILPHQGRPVIVNEDLGEWEDDVWYSNLDHRKSTTIFYGAGAWTGTHHQAYCCDNCGGKVTTWLCDGCYEDLQQGLHDPNFYGESDREYVEWAEREANKTPELKLLAAPMADED